MTKKNVICLFSIIIDSDQPLLASVLSTFTYGKSSEIAWATAADDLAKWSVNLTGSRPTLTFSGKKINVAISLIIFAAGLISVARVFKVDAGEVFK